MFFFQKALCRNAKCFLWIYRLHLVVGTENIDDLVSDHLLDLVSADLKVSLEQFGSWNGADD